uniref:Uncharacterized protein n=1 Tax=Trichuris muris TaxID=70415 RepID=A0A5S6QHG4_TRIMR
MRAPKFSEHNDTLENFPFNGTNRAGKLNNESTLRKVLSLNEAGEMNPNPLVTDLNESKMLNQAKSGGKDDGIFKNGMGKSPEKKLANPCTGCPTKENAISKEKQRGPVYTSHFEFIRNQVAPWLNANFNESEQSTSDVNRIDGTNESAKMNAQTQAK